MVSPADKRHEAAILDRVRRTEARATAPAAQGSLFDQFLELDAKLVSLGFPPTSPWWIATLRRFYASACRWLVLRVGRRGGKSSTLSRMAVCEALYGAHSIPPGDIGVCAIVSVDKSEGAKRLYTVKVILDALGVKYQPMGGQAVGVMLADRPIAFQVFAATIAGVSGFTAVNILCDEVAKWKDKDTGTNPATEVLSSIRPTMQTQPNARMFLSSSPVGELDAHAAAYRDGENASQQIAMAPTWVGNPTVTEEQTHRDEPNEDKWRREYAAIPMEGTEASALSAAMLDRCTRSEGIVAREAGVYVTAWMDPGFTHNAWTLAVAGQRMVGDRVRRSVLGIWQWQGTPSKPNDPAMVLQEIAVILANYGLSTVHSDQYEKFGLHSIGKAGGLNVVVPDDCNRLEMYEAMITQFASGEAEIPPDMQLRADMLGIKQRLTPNGFTIQLQEVGDRHCDYAPSVVGAMWLANVAPKLEAVRPKNDAEMWEQWDRDEERRKREMPEDPWKDEL